MTVELLGAIGVALATPEVPRDAAAKATLHSQVENQIESLREAIDKRWKSHLQLTLAVRSVVSAFPAEVNYWRIQFTFWFYLLTTCLWITPSKLASATLEYLNQQKERSLEAMERSVGGFIAPLAIFSAGLVSPVVDATRYLKRRYWPPPTPPSSHTAGVWATVSENVFYQPHHMRQSRAILHIREATRRPQKMALDWSATNLRSDEGVKCLQPLRPRDERHNVFQHYQLWFTLRIIIGTICFMVLQLLGDGWRTWKPRRYRDLHNDIVDWGELVSSWLGPWAYFGFLATLSISLEGTVKRGLLRFCGAVLGTFAAWLCLVIFPRSAWGQGIWMCIFDFAAVWFAAHNKTPLLSLDPTWGYGVQIFIWQQALIIVPAYLHQAAANELVISCLFSQIIGVSAAIAAAAVIAPTRCSRAVRLHLADAWFCLKESMVGLIELSFLGDLPWGDSSTFKTKSFGVEEAWDEWTAHVGLRCEAANSHLRRARILFDDNNYLSKIFDSPKSLMTICNSIERLSSYRMLFRDCLYLAKKVEETRATPLTKDDPAVMVNMESARRALADVCKELDKISLLLVTAVDHFQRWHWPWQQSDAMTGARLGEIFETCADQATLRLRSLATHVMEQNLLFAEDHQNSSFDGGDSFTLLLDRRSIMWAFLHIELEEYRWITAQIVSTRLR
eukprot:Gregarina_sp_Poly_1__3496@NODE_2017_length_2849_cov_229_177570_g344_i1_p1_GENE_NODE_2017_length_2849_cov_229_177570_g344_i1NODE_2017_length_2849_cov_229_177570_g344_i1_p1_ORF_typecomplete_len752_score102_18FUSC_2/PF13515_6/1_3e04FUSC_2/PF13515_6/7_1e03FUSC_2/PF13515_6/1_2e11ALMT/PF11744_8/2_2e03ALMT/PF11744_8/4_6e09FUSC/PF04632_12/1_3e02FUSC/PF04632_12/2_4e03FUSC/PF04632_12/5_5e08FUSC/PF04632_12/8_2e02ArAE_1/PF06081_11/0_11ABC_membrane_3/PF13748_6/0_15ABC_membrane_3/PF13748_6/5e03_NODE_2017_leng